MKKVLLLSLLLNICNYVFSEYYFGAQLGANHPITTYKTTRNMGGEFGFIYGKKVYNSFFIETGLIVDAYGKKDNSIVNYHKSNVSNDTSLEYYTEDGSYIKLSAQIPILLSHKIINDKFYLRTGFLLTVRNWLTFTNYSGYDPEVDSHLN